MHAVKHLALQSLQADQSRLSRRHSCPTELQTEFERGYDRLLQVNRTRLRDRFAALATVDKVFASLFRLVGTPEKQPILGVGSFGMVLLAEASVDVSARLLLEAQRAKCAVEQEASIDGFGLQRLAVRKSLVEHAESDDEEAPLLLAKGDLVAVKFEYNIDRRRRKFQLAKEYNLLTELFNCYGDQLEGFPEPYLFGCLDDGEAANSGSLMFSETGADYYCYHFMVMELLGENLRTRFDKLPPVEQQHQQQKASPDETAFPVEFVFDVARQLLTRLMLLHAAPISVAHNDLKLDQLMLGRGARRHTVYLVDFGLSCKYRQRLTNSHWGNRRYASRFSHRGVASPLTDLESAAYIVARFLHNAFPWDGLPCSASDSLSRRRRMAGVKSELWQFVDRARRGQCLQQHQPSAWPRLFFTNRTDARGRGGPELLKCMSRLSEYHSRASQESPSPRADGQRPCLVSMPAEDIDYNYLFNCFVLPPDPTAASR